MDRTQPLIALSVKPRALVLYHVLFWAFIYAFVLDYFADQHPLPRALAYSAIEVLLYATIAYTHLYLIIPAAGSSLWRYAGLLVGFWSLSLLVYSVVGLEGRLMGDVSLRSKLSYTLNFSLFIIISYLYSYVFAYLREKQRALETRNAMLASEVELLRSRISPHFLFNSLNNLYALTLAKSDDAAPMIEKLTGILRYLLDKGGETRVPLSMEANMVEDVLHLQRLRRARGAGNIRFERHGIADAHTIAPLVLVNLVENAVKHGDMQVDPNGFVHVRMNVMERRLSFVIENSTTIFPSGEGIGLPSVRRLLELNYGSAHSFQVSTPPGRFKVELSIDV